MTPSLREERKVRTATTIASAALDLFAVRGYAAVTMSEIAAAARVGERTLYRYFADKDDLLFGEDEALRAALGTAIDEQPDAAPFAVLRGASTDVARLLEDRWHEVVRRARVIASSPALVERERAKHAAWEGVLAQGLARRGLAGSRAALLARITVACYDEAMSRWLAQDEPRRTLHLELDTTFAELATLAADLERD